MALDVRYLEGKFIAKDTVELRDYQVNLADQAKQKNCVIVLPTGLGKTVVALHVIAEFLQRGMGVLFLAPTRVLVNQHHTFLKNSLTIGDIALITGEDTIARRKKLWNSSIVCATPEIVKNDLDRQLVAPEQFGLVIFDEVHRTAGNYAYSAIAERLPEGAHIVGMTATLPSEREKAKEIMGKLGIRDIAQRTEEDADVKPYIQDTETQWINVELPGELKEIQALVKLALDERYEALQKKGARVTDRSLSALLRMRVYVLNQNRYAAKPLFTAIRITYALNILEAHGITPFLKFCERTSKKKGAGTRELFEQDPNFTRAVRLAKAAQAGGIEHSKMPVLEEIVQKNDGRTLVFSSYRDSVDVIRSRLVRLGVPAGILIGKAGQTGLKQRQQVEAVEKFRDGTYRVLIATRVGEEGLDISEVNLVVFYDNVPSSIRHVQRRGRTGRRKAGRLVVLIAKGTIDERYYWIGKRKISSARGMGEQMSRIIQEPAGLDEYS